jgi:hypothetical protein
MREGSVVLGFFRTTVLTVVDEQEFQGMARAAEMLIRGLSPFYEDSPVNSEDDPKNVPKIVQSAIAQMEANLLKATSLADRNARYLTELHQLGEAIGAACWEKALSTRISK